MDLLREFRMFLLAEKRLEPTTIATYVSDVDRFLNFATAEGEPLNGAAAEKYLHQLMSMGRRSGYRRHVRMSIRRLYHWLAIHKQAFDVNEVDKIDPISEERENLPTLTYEEIQKLLAACEGRAAERNHMMIRLLFETGMRVSELCGLNLSDMKPGMNAVQITAKGRIDRVIPLTGECFAALQDYARRWRTRHAVATPALFVNEKSRKGQRIKRRRVSGLIADMARTARVGRSSAHTLRRSRATQLLDHGVQVEEVQKFLGQQSINATERYINTTPEKIRGEFTRCFQSLTAGPELA